MPRRQERHSSRTETGDTTGDFSRLPPGTNPADSRLFRPSALLRRVLTLVAREGGREGIPTVECSGDVTAPSASGMRAPGLRTTIGAALVVGAAAGFLELA